MTMTIKNLLKEDISRYHKLFKMIQKLPWITSGEISKFFGYDFEKSKKIFNMFLENTKIVETSIGVNRSTKSLGIVEHIKGDLDIQFSDIEKFNYLKRIDGALDAEGCELYNLGSLEYIGRYCDLWNCRTLHDLGNLKYVGGGMNLRGTPFENRVESDIRQDINIEGDITFE